VGKNICRKAAKAWINCALNKADAGYIISLFGVLNQQLSITLRKRLSNILCSYKNIQES